nr:retrovirus-related Pol polyprotein from transposon TNT 1-94 [Tanacetum cinerariifolium]
MYCDSKAAIAISCNPVQHSRTKHIDVRYHFIKEKVKKDIVELFFVETEYHVAGLFNKALPVERFQYLVRRLEHPSDTKVFTMKMEILLEPTSNKLLVGSYALSWKPCQGDSLNLPDHRFSKYNADDVDDEGSAGVDVDAVPDTVMDDQEDVSKQGEIIANIDADEDVILKDVAAVEKTAEIEENADDDDATITTATTPITAATTLITAATITDAPSAARMRKGVVIKDPKETTTQSIIIYFEPKSKDKGKSIMVEEPKPLQMQAQIEKDEAYARELEAELNKNINWDDVIEQVQRKEKEDNDVMRYQTLKRKPQIEAQARKNMMIYLWNMARFKMNYFKGMSYDVIRPIFKKYFNLNLAFLEKSKEQLEEEKSGALKRASKSRAEKAAKKQKLDEEVEELKKHLQIVPNDEDDRDSNYLIHSYRAVCFKTFRLVPAKSNLYYQVFNVKSLYGEIDCPKKSQVKLKGQIKMIHVQGDLTTLKCHIKAHNQESQSMNN